MIKLIKSNDKNDREVIRSLKDLGSKEVKIYKTNTDCKVIYCIENGKEHVSISHVNRNPNWEEIKLVRYKLMKDDVDVAQILPPKDQYVNVHKYCFHLWELQLK